MAQPTLFSMLARAPWWASVLIAAALFAVTQLFLPDIVAAFAALPFLVSAAYAGWRQARTPGAVDTTRMLAKLQAMSWDNFSAVIAEAFRRDGYSVTETDHEAASLELRKNGRLTLASCRRWKVAQTGIAPLRDLRTAMRARDADNGCYVAAGLFTSNARAYAQEHNIALIDDARLAQLVSRVAAGKRPWMLRIFRLRGEPPRD